MQPAYGEPVGAGVFHITRFQRYGLCFRLHRSRFRFPAWRPQMTIRRITFASRGLALMLLAAGLGTGDAAPASVAASGADPQCWKRPGPETLEEIVQLSGKDGRRLQKDLEGRAPSRNVLLLSDGY